MAESNERGSAARDGGRQQDGEERSPSRGGKSNRGFASMSPERQREIASKGGRAAHEKGTAHEWTADEARRAGRKGGETVSRDRAHMAAIGREGGGARSARRNTPPRGEEAVSERGNSERGSGRGQGEEGNR